jgi:3-phenylpropionate/trans-cinnamate dioxygenase ferredoxin reductase subunit
VAGSQAQVIVGAALAGASAARTLREEGFTGPVVLVGEESEAPYERPPLSKGYLQGKAERDSTYVVPQSWYAEHDVELRLGRPVTALDLAAHEIELAGGERLGYARLLLATGSSPRTLPVPGAELDGVHYLRTLADSDRLKAVLGQAKRLVVIGAGWIGLETAAAARAAGLDVTVLELARLPLLRVLGPEVAQVFADLHTRHGVDLRTEVQVAEIVAGDAADGAHVTGVRLRDGSVVPADAILVGAGISPNTGLAEAAGLAVDNGIVVDEHLRSSDPDVFAAGDVASAFHPVLGKHIRVEHWANALNQPKSAARGMLGRPEPYTRLPYFYTDQFELGMEYTGYVEPAGSDAALGYDQVVFRGDPKALEFIAFWLRQGRVLAGMNVNVWDVTDPIKALIARHDPIDPAALADTGQPLESLARP